MDWKDQPAANDIEQFLRDVREHFRASLETSEYENTSNTFHLTEAESTLKLLLRCELLLANYTKGGDVNSTKSINSNNNKQQLIINENVKPNEVSNSNNAVEVNGINGQSSMQTVATTKIAVHSQCNNNTIIKNDAKQMQQQQQKHQQQQQSKQKHEDVSYLDMSGGGRRVSSKKSSSWYDDWNNETKSDKTFRCSAPLDLRNDNQAYSDDDFDDDDDDDDDDVHDEVKTGGGNSNCNVYDVEANEDDDNCSQNYDICEVSSHADDRDEMQKAITPELEAMQMIDCPYMDLPAGHLSIERATKYGQLQRIEKRLFFDQCKKYYCGVLNDWLLCYADGPTSAHPTITLYLKHNGIEIEHYGEGKRREVCFQITTTDPNKKFLFQANSEVDAKEWIIAVEAAIRGDTAPAANNMKITRKLPTPPIVKKITFVGHKVNAPAPSHDCIYDEPSPLFQAVNALTNKAVAAPTPPNLPQKAHDTLSALDHGDSLEYDVPKCPPQPIHPKASESNKQTESETVQLLNLNENSLVGMEKIEFQSIVKDVHSKLSSQLSAGPAAAERLKRAVKKTYSGSSSSDVEAVALTTITSTPSFTAKDQLKKQRKSSSCTPNASPQKSSSCVGGGISSPNNSNTSGNERTAVKSWFFNRLNKTSSSTRSNNSSSANSANTSPAKCKQSEKENLLQSLDVNDAVDGCGGVGGGGGGTDCLHNNSSNPSSPILKNSTFTGGNAAGIDSSMKSKVNLIIKEFESSAHMGILTMETLAGSAVASLSSFCDNDCNNYEPIMTVTTPPSSFLKKI